MKTWKRNMATLLLAGSLTGALWAAPTGKSFKSPEDAAKAASQAFQKNDRSALLTIFGAEYKRLESVDAAERSAAASRLAALFKEGWSLSTTQDQSRLIRLGSEGWSFPVPLVKTGSLWRFDTVGGEEEIANRRVGRNELATIETMRLIAEAQTEYHKQDRDGDGKPSYTAKLVSETGQKDGLYWPKSGSEESPLSKVIGDIAEFSTSRVKGTPWYGYYYSLSLGKDGGYVLAAWPASYPTTGVMSFWCDESGNLWEKDLGAKGGALIRDMDSASPPQGWAAVED